MPATVRVSNATQLTSAAQAARGGDTILLEPGNYGAVSLKNLAPSGEVMVRSADPNRDAVITDLKLTSVKNFTFADLDVNHVLAAGEALFTPAITVAKSDSLSFIGLDFAGSRDGSPWNDGYGISVRGSDNIVLANSTFTELFRSAVFNDVDNLLVTGNKASVVREGFNFAAVDNVVISKNAFSDFRPNYADGDHSDAIQFWNNGVARGSSDVIIRDNSILTGANGGTQGIFIRAENPLLRHSDFTIENNLYHGDARHGITLGGVDNAVIRGNTIVTAQGGMLETAINVNKSSNVVVANNVSSLLLVDTLSTRVTQTNNIDVWDRTQKRGVTLESLFTDTSAGVRDHHDFTARADGAAARQGAGFRAVDGIGTGLAGDMGALASAYGGALDAIGVGGMFL